MHSICERLGFYAIITIIFGTVQLLYTFLCQQLFVNIVFYVKLEESQEKYVQEQGHVKGL